MKPFLFFAVTLFLGGIACSSSKMAGSSAIREGISGRVTEITGNRMPGPGSSGGRGTGILTTVLIYEPTSLSQVTRVGDSPVYTAIRTKQVASVQTDSTGAFSIALAPGSYSLFIQRPNGYYANLFDTANNIALFTVEPNKVTKADLVVRERAVF